MKIFKNMTSVTIRDIVSQTVNTVTVLSDTLLSRFGSKTNGMYQNIFTNNSTQLIPVRAVNSGRFPLEN